MSTPALSVEHLTLAIGDAITVDDISFSLGQGEVMAIVGESGCGKSITALAIMRLLPPAIRRTGGTIRCGEDDITSVSERAMQAIRGRRMSMIFQEPQAALDPLATIGTQIAEALRQPLSRARSTVRKMLEDVGIADPERRIDQRPFEMSGGMCQRVMIASALISRPSILIADEPTTALDVTIQAQILDLLRQIAVERQTAVVLITHDMGVVADIADRVAVMYAGRLAEAAPAEAIFTAPRHPYTALLLASIPRVSDVPKSQLVSIDGRVPTPAEYGIGCRFANRCPRADARCTVETPKLRPVGPTHLSACHHAEAMQ
jgi:oligopeptide/dipeptide ABC transporter ATP-binding protein